MTTAGRTVAYSAVTVALAMCSLVVFPLRFLQSMGIGGAITALTAAAVALTLLPALFVLFGERLGRVRPGRPREGRWYRHAHRVLRHPGLVALLTGRGADRAHRCPRSGPAGAGSTHACCRPRRAPARSNRRCGANTRSIARPPRSSPSTPGPPPEAELHAYAARLARGRRRGGRRPRPATSAAGTWQIDVTLAGEAIAPEAQRAIARHTGDLPSAFVTQLGGSGAEFTDQRAAIADSLPLALAILVGGTLLVLWLMTGSAVLPVMALAMNLLTVGAATGLLVLIFQDGTAPGPARVHLPGRHRTEQLPRAGGDRVRALDRLRGVPVHPHQGGPRPRRRGRASRSPWGSSGRGGSSPPRPCCWRWRSAPSPPRNVVFLKEIGVGAVAAVLLDAFVVRTLLVPALMGLLGELELVLAAAVAQTPRAGGGGRGDRS